MFAATSQFARDVVWITGAASGQGRNHAKRFAAAGARVGCIDLAQDGLSGLVSEIRANGGQAEAVVADVSDWEAMSAAATSFRDRFGPATIVVANAGIGGDSKHLNPVEKTALSEWDRVIGVNLTGCFYTARVAIPQLRESGHGSIIVTSSTLGVSGAPNWGAYTASKHGVLGLMKCLANELSPEIRVNAICPGTVDTPILDWEAEAYGVDRETLMRREGETHLIKRVLTVNEISNAVLWLASDGASGVTGVTFPVDGGWLENRAVF